MNPDGRVMRRYERELKATVLGAFQRLQSDLFDGISEADAVGVTARLEWREVITPFRDSIIGGLQRIAIAGAEFGREQVERHVFGVKAIEAMGVKQDGPLSIDWQLANNEAAEWALRYGYDLVRGLTDTTRARLQVEISQFVRNSETLPELIGRLEDLFGPIRAEAVGVTETTRLFQQGSLASWKATGGIIDGKEVRVSEDELVCPICSLKSGQVYALDDPEGDPPFHVRCRCWSVPVVATEGEVEEG